MKIRTGRLEKEMTDEAAVYTSSLDFDRFIFDADIQCNYAHTSMLKAQGIIDEDVADKILDALNKLRDEGFDALEFDHSVEDVHMAVENYVTKLVGPEAGFMHTAKSRNDQVATDIRLLLRERIEEIQIGILEFIEGIVELAKEHKGTVMIGYTHLQHAQPTYKRVNINPLGSAAMATTSFPIDRELTTELLGFDDYMENSMDGVSSRDHIAETVFDLTMLTTTLSKICEELVLWSTYEFGIVTMADEYSSTSSIMPQKKNPDVAEVARSKCAIVNGEITPHLWNAMDVAYDTLKIVNHMLLTVKFNTDRCMELAGANFATATDLADIMVRERRIPFRTAHKIVGRIVNEATAEGLNPEEIDSEYVDAVAVELGFDKLELDNELLKNALNPVENVKIRNVPGGPAPEMVQLAIDHMNEFLDLEFERLGI